MQGCSFSKRYAEMEVALRVMGSTRNGCRFYLNKGYDCSGNKSIMSAWFLQTRTVARCFFFVVVGFFFFPFGHLFCLFVLGYSEQMLTFSLFRCGFGLHDIGICCYFGEFCLHVFS